MYIGTNQQTYPCTGRSQTATTVRFELPDTVPEALGDTVSLHDDSGYELCAYAVADYLRTVIGANALTLTNEPEAVEPDTTDTGATEPDTLTQIQLAVAELAETEAAHDLENKVAIAELAEAMAGGET